MNRTLMIFTNLLLVLLIVSSLPVYAQKAVCVYCGVELPNGIHKPGCPYFKKPSATGSKPATSNSGNKSGSAPGSVYIFNAINSLLDGISDPETDQNNEEIAAREKRINDSIQNAKHDNMMKSFKMLDNSKPAGMKSIDDYSPGKFNKVNFNCKITSYTGVVEILRKGKLIAESRNIGEIELQPGDVIRTGTMGIVKLHYNFENGGKDLILGGHTELEIIKNESGNNIPMLRRGRFFAAGETVPENVQKYVWNYKNNLKKQADLRTPDAVCAVRGTLFTIDQDDAAGSEFNVFNGSILVAPITGTDSVLLTKGKRVVVSPQGKISDLLPADLKKLALWRDEITKIESEENTIK